MRRCQYSLKSFGDIRLTSGSVNAASSGLYADVDAPAAEAEDVVATSSSLEAGFGARHCTEAAFGASTHTKSSSPSGRVFCASASFGIRSVMPNGITTSVKTYGDCPAHLRKTGLQRNPIAFCE